ncbi:hypothetical protein J4208_00230 [Candidatus Woesearchaeota archaeon]|nr:hypothetical protein [Candidatus Woesearchaeota archaeon]
MTETPNPSPLEKQVAEKKLPEKEKPLTLADLTGGLAKGLLPLAAGAGAGYWATGSPGGVGVSLLLTSLGMSWATENDTSRSDFIADYFYRVGAVVGAVTGIAAAYVWFEQNGGKK